MATNICIIDIDLGINIERLISDDIKSLTARSQEELDKALEAAKAAKLLRDNKAEHEKKIETSINNVLTDVYNMLVEAAEEGVPVSTCMGKVVPFITTPAALTTRMRTFLERNGNQYILDRKKIFATQHYVLIPFNKTQE